MVNNPSINIGDSGDVGLIPESGRFLAGRNSNPLQYFCLENTWTEEMVGYSPQNFCKELAQLSMHEC